jgi:PAS domain S-box-containing protein
VEDSNGRAELDAGVYREAFLRTESPALVVDTNFVIREVNDRGLELLGYEYDDLVGESALTIAGDRAVYDEIVETLANGDVWTGQFPAETSRGRTVYGSGSASPIVVDDELRGAVGAFADTTKRRQYENASEVLNRLLRHDLRNELNVMYGHIQRAQSALDSAEAEESLSRAKDKILDIVHKSERARDLRELLDRSTTASNRPVRLDIVLNNTLVEVMHEFNDAEYRFEVFPEVAVVADDLLSPAVESLLENAVIHNDAASPTVWVDVEVGDDEVVLSVADDGPGIPESQRDLIFGREEVDQLHHGTGISLFFVDCVVDSYGGDVWVEDNDPEGSVFKIRLDRP